MTIHHNKRRAAQGKRLHKAMMLPGICAGVALLASVPSYADDSSDQDTVAVTPAPLPDIEIKGKETVSWDSNPLMLATGAKSLFGSVTSPELILRSTTPIASISADTRLDENIYNQSDFNSTDVHEDINLKKQLEQWGAAIEGRADYDTVRTSELTTYGLNLPSVRHTGLSAAPELSYQFTSIDRVALDGNVIHSTYNNDAFVDFNVFSVTPSYMHSFDERNQGLFSIQTQRYQATSGNKTRVDSVGPSVGWVTQLTPRLTGKITAGVQKSWQAASATADASQEWNYIFTADLAFKGKQDTTDLTATRSQYPFSNGTETLLTSFALKETHNLNSKVALNAAGNYQFAKSPPASTTTINLDREYGASAGAAYHVTDHVDLDTTYQYRNETLTGVNGNIPDHLVLVSIAYHPFTATPLNHDD
ncbi:MAG TPA: outer membrane beta-barrel protein [Rickettsiales bacterium]|nr:outer membrane beta-barrel protein [Rickettsiales bacterium]